ncbi:MAG: radical SAM protein [Victivallaceae bacterium]|nr:radical SAM protein [Victivallaceae bacterium]
MGKKSSYVVTKNLNQASLWRNTKPLLGRLDIELTERCNNNCIHCCINLAEHDKTARDKELSTKELKNILVEAADLGCMMVRFTGGEPLLRDDFEELYIFTRKLGMKVILFTNGRLITLRLVELFAKMPPGEKIEITVYGMTKGSYDSAVRRQGAYEEAWQGINLLLANNIPFVVKGALLPSNKTELKEFEDFASTVTWMDRGPSYSMFFDLRGRRDSEKRNAQIKALRLSPEEGLSILTRDKKEYMKDKKQFCAKFTRPAGNNLFSCGAGKGSACVDAYGKLQLCMGLRHPDTVFDLRKQSIKTIMTERFADIRKMQAKNPRYMERCAKCFLKGLCEQCPGKSWTEHGTLDTPVQYFCDITHAQAEYLGLLGKGEKAWTVENWQERIRKFVEEV